MKVLRCSDIITLKANGVECDFSVLSYEKSLELNSFTTIDSGKTLVDGGKQTRHIVKNSVKEIRGVEDFHGQPVTIKAEGPCLTDEATEDAISVLINTPFVRPLAYISSSARPKGFDGVDILLNGKVIDLGNEV
jgi:hypothetical protein